MPSPTGLDSIGASDRVAITSILLTTPEIDSIAVYLVAKAAAGPTRRGRIGRGDIIWRCRESRRVACAAVGRDRVKNWGFCLGRSTPSSLGLAFKWGSVRGSPAPAGAFRRHLMAAKLYLWHQTLFR